MLHAKLRLIVKDIEQYRNLPSIYNIQRMDISDRDSKIEVVIRLMKFINGMDYQGSYSNMTKKIPFNERKFNQAFATAISFYWKKHIVVWIFVQILENLINDLNMDVPDKANYQILKDIIEGPVKEWEIREYDDFFDQALTADEKEVITEKKKNNDLTWLSDIDWKSMSFLFTWLDKTDISIASRADAMTIKDNDIKNIIDNQLEKDALTEWCLMIYNNIWKIQWNKRRFIYIYLLTAALFRQDYKIYPVLNKAFIYLTELLEKEW